MSASARATVSNRFSGSIKQAAEAATHQVCSTEGNRSLWWGGAQICCGGLHSRLVWHKPQLCTNGPQQMNALQVRAQAGTRPLHCRSGRQPKARGQTEVRIQPLEWCWLQSECKSGWGLVRSKRLQQVILMGPLDPAMQLAMQLGGHASSSKTVCWQMLQSWPNRHKHYYYNNTMEQGSRKNMHIG